MKKYNLTLSSIFNEGVNKNNFDMLFSLLITQNFLLPISDNSIVFLTTSDDKVYIPLFTDEKEIKDIEYTSLDSVSLLKIINEVYNTGKFYAISINPFSDEVILNSKMICLINSKSKRYLDRIKGYCDEICLFSKIKKNIVIDYSSHNDIPKLDDKKIGIYIYMYNNDVLKIGKAWSNSKERWLYQHYNFKSCKSNLSSSIRNDIVFCYENDIMINGKSEEEQIKIIKKWICENTIRINIIIDRYDSDEMEDDDYFILNLIESWLHYKCNPKFEGYNSQRKNDKGDGKYE